MISLQVWLLALLVALPFYTYSFNQPGQQEDVFKKRSEIDDVHAELERRQQIATDPEVLASVSSVLQSVSDVIRSITENPELFTASLSEIEASLSSVILSVSSDLFPIITDDNSTPTPTGDDDDETPTPTNTPRETSTTSTGTPGEVVTSDGKTGTVGDDGTTRFCSATSYLCPASVNYGCCREGYRCGLTACTPTGNNVPTTAGPNSCSFGSFLCPASLNYGCCPNGYECATAACVPTVSDAPSISRTDIPFNPTDGGSSKGGAEDGGDNNNSNDGGSSGLSGGAIGGIVGGVIGGIALIAGGLVWLFLSKRKKKNAALATTTPTGPAPPPTSEQYTGGPLPPQPQMSQYNSPTSPPPPHDYPSPQGQGGFYQPYPQQYQQPGYQQNANVSELGGAAMPYGQKGAVPQPPQDVVEAPANPAQQQPHPNQQGGYKGPPTGPVYELS